MRWQRAVVIGASGGIGAAVASALEKGGCEVIALGRSERSAAYLDLEREDTIAAAAEHVAAGGSPDLVFVATGLLHEGDVAPEKDWRDLDAASMARNFAVNSIGPTLVAKHFLPLLPVERTACFATLSARVGSISDNRLGGWYSYRASKAALNMLVRTLSVELKRKNPSAVCVGLHPGTVDTPLSEPFQRNVPEGKLFTPEYSAAKLLGVLARLECRDSGKLFAWDGQEIAP